MGSIVILEKGVGFDRPVSTQYVEKKVLTGVAHVDFTV